SMNLLETIEQLAQFGRENFYIALHGNENSELRANLIANIEGIEYFPPSMATVHELVQSLAMYYEVSPNFSSVYNAITKGKNIPLNNNNIIASLFESNSDSNFSFYLSQST